MNICKLLTRYIFSRGWAWPAFRHFSRREWPCCSRAITRQVEGRFFCCVDYYIQISPVITIYYVSKVKSLFWVHIQAQSSALQTLTSTSPGHWAFTLHIHLDIHLNSLGVYSRSHATWRHGLQIWPHRYPLRSWVERSNAVWSALLRGTTSRRTGRVLNSGLDLDPNPESCTLPLDQLATAVLRPVYTGIYTSIYTNMRV